MSHLFAMSFDWAASPSIELKPAESTDVENRIPYGWGFAWYPPQGDAVVVIKDPTSLGENPMTQVLRDWNRFRSSIFVCHIRGAAKRTTQQDTHPFARSFAGRDWTLAHNGDLEGDLDQELPLGTVPVFTPVGRTDSEHAFCWLLTRILEARARTLEEFGWENVRSCLQRMDDLGTANFLLSDGKDLVVYQDRDGFNPLHWIRRKPPYERTHLEGERISLDLSDPLDLTRTMVLVSTQPLSHETWSQFIPGQMLVIRRGDVIWNSHAEAAAVTTVTAGEPVASLEQAWTSLDPAEEEFVQDDGPRYEGDEYGNSGHFRPQARQGQARRAGLEKLGKLPRNESSRPRRVLHVVHETTYAYGEPVERSSHSFRVRPIQDRHQMLMDHHFSISVDGFRRDYEDVFGNQVTRLEVESPYEEMILRSESMILLNELGPLNINAPWQRLTIPLVWMPWHRQMMSPYLLPPELPETQLRELSDFAMSFVERQGYDLIETLEAINRTIYKDFSYISGSTHLETTPFDVYVNRRGVCQDFANLFICLSRLLGIPARYRVGYIYTGSNYENKVQSEASHAWAELYLPWLGWRGFDPTNGCLVGLDHVRVACGRNYRDATPTSGTIFKGGGAERLGVNVRVTVLGSESDGAPQGTTGATE